jgi:hypothetical protein
MLKKATTSRPNLLLALPDLLQFKPGTQMLQKATESTVLYHLPSLCNLIPDYKLHSGELGAVHGRSSAQI